MTITTDDDRKKKGTGNGSATSFPYDFRIEDEADLKVYLRNTSTEAETLQTLNTNYTVTGVQNDAGGNVVFTGAPSATEQVVILADTPRKQSTDLPSSGAMLAENIEAALDTLTRHVQELEERLSRAPLLKPSTTLSDVPLPLEADGYLKWNAGATALETDTTLGTSGGATSLSALTDTSITGAAQYQVLQHNGSAWGNVTNLDNLARLGIGSSSDATNKLTVASAAVLFNRGTDDIQVKLNKEAAADTASFLYQTGFSGRAEFGTIGDDDFTLKVSPDGSNFYTSFVVDKDTGDIVFSQDVTIATGSVAAATLPIANQAEVEAETASKLLDGSNTKYHPGVAKAWVNFNGTGTAAIVSAYNIDGITDNGTGDYTLDFTTALSSANMCAVGMNRQDTSNSATLNIHTLATGSARVRSGADSDSATDTDITCVAVFGDFA